MTVVPMRPSRRTSFTAAELMQLELPEPRWAVSGLVPEGLNLLVGASKLGKSWLALGLGLAIASGGTALGSVPVEQGDALVLALEDTPRRLQSRLRVMLSGEPAPDRLHLATECARIGQGGEERIRAWLDSAEHPRLVVVDILERLRPRAPSAQSAYSADYDAMADLKALADDSGVPFLVLHHTRKATAEDFIESVSGTNGIAGSADSVLVLSRSRGSADAVLKVTGRDVEEADHALSFDPHAGTWRLLDGPASDHQLGDTRRRIISAIRQHGPMTPKQIAERLGIKPNTARQTCGRMAADGQLRDDSGTYNVPLAAVTSVTLSPPEDPHARIQSLSNGDSDAVTGVTAHTGELL